MNGEFEKWKFRVKYFMLVQPYAIPTCFQIFLGKRVSRFRECIRTECEKK